MATSLHEQRIDAVLQALLNSGATSVLDLGCGPGVLLTRLARERRFKEIVGVDTSIEALIAAERELSRKLAWHMDRVSLIHGSFASMDERLTGFDAAAMVETIEHIEPDRLSKVERAVFACYRPNQVLITTPNREYNSLYRKPARQFRCRDHRFEWSRAKFEAWCAGVAARNGYGVVFTGIGWAHPRLGCPTQMAEFVLIDSAAADPL